MAGANPIKRRFVSNSSASSIAVPFLQSRRRQRFLEYLVKETLAGRSDRLKGYTIALEVFDRPETFDPAGLIPSCGSRPPACVRSFANITETNGQGDPIHIDLPKGTYTPQIEFRHG